LQAVREIKAGKTGRVFRVEITAATEARQKLDMSQSEFAGMLGESVRSLQDWERGWGNRAGIERFPENRPDVAKYCAEGLDAA